MKKQLIFLLLMISTVLSSKAQQGYDFASFDAYRSNMKTFGYKAGLEFSRVYNRRFALYADYFQNFSGLYKEYTLDIFYKPQLFQHRNTGLRLVMGGGLGSNSSSFQAVPTIGFEAYHVFWNNWEIAAAANGAYAIAGPYDWRYQLHINLKIPLF